MQPSSGVLVGDPSVDSNLITKDPANFIERLTTGISLRIGSPCWMQLELSWHKRASARTTSTRFLAEAYGQIQRSHPRWVPNLDAFTHAPLFRYRAANPFSQSWLGLLFLSLGRFQLLNGLTRPYPQRTRPTSLPTGGDGSASPLQSQAAFIGFR